MRSSSLIKFVCLVTVSTGAAFTPAGQWGVHHPRRHASSRTTPLFSAVEEAPVAQAQVAVATTTTTTETTMTRAAPATDSSTGLSGAEIKARLEKQLAKMRQKDKASPYLTRSEVKVLLADNDIIVANKPAGLLSVCSNKNPNMAQAVYDAFGSELANENRMVVHRLGMDTSGVMVFGKTKEAVRGLNAAFRARKVERTYEALVAGHIQKDSGMISLPLMRDYEFPPFMRVSTDEHQRALIDLDPEVVGKKLLSQPKDSLTKYEVVSREEFEGQPVTRVTLTSISGRTHQLNVHMAAFGHPIVGDSTYGLGGDAAPNGGLTVQEQDALVPNPSRASEECQKALASARPCVHAKSLKFRHPVTQEEVSISVDAPF